MIYCQEYGIVTGCKQIHVTVVCSIQMKNRKIVELSDIYLYICYFFLSHEALDHNITLYLFMSCQFLLQL
jgi:hypothetical protein